MNRSEEFLFLEFRVENKEHNLPCGEYEKPLQRNSKLIRHMNEQWVEFFIPKKRAVLLETPKFELTKS